MFHVQMIQLETLICNQSMFNFFFSNLNYVYGNCG